MSEETQLNLYRRAFLEVLWGQHAARWGVNPDYLLEKLALAFTARSLHELRSALDASNQQRFEVRVGQLTSEIRHLRPALAAMDVAPPDDTPLMGEFTGAAEALAAWDRGDIVWTIEMGGIGPGYEQAIHVLVFEIVRDQLGQPLPDDAAWSTWGDDTVHRVNDWPGCGFSGAQVGAAKALALRFLRDGHRATLDSMRVHDRSRLTQVSRTWPHEPEKGPST